MKKILIILVLVIALFSITRQQAHAQLSNLWKYVGTLQPVISTWFVESRGFSGSVISSMKLKNCDSLDGTSTGMIVCGTDATGSSVNTGAILNAGNGIFVNVSGDTMTGALNVQAALSGSSLFTLSRYKTCTLKTTATGQTICGTDNAGNFGSGNVISLSDPRYVNIAGDAMTGALSIDVSGGNRNTIGLKIINTMSGAVVHAEKTLTASGKILIENDRTAFNHGLEIYNTPNDVGPFRTNTAYFHNHTSARVNNPGFVFNFDEDVTQSGFSSGDGAFDIVQFQVDDVPKFTINSAGSFTTQDRIVVQPNIFMRSSLESFFMHIGIPANSGNSSPNMGGLWVNATTIAAATQVFGVHENGSLFFFMSPNVGIDTTTPGSKLSVSGSVIIGSNIGSAAADAGVALEILGTMSGRSLGIGGTTSKITSILSASQWLDFGNLLTAGCETLNMTVTGASLGDFAAITVPLASATTNVIWGAPWVSSSNTLTLQACTVVSGDPPLGLFKAEVHKSTP